MKLARSRVPRVPHDTVCKSPKQPSSCEQAGDHEGQGGGVYLGLLNLVINARIISPAATLSLNYKLLDARVHSYSQSVIF